MSFLNAVLVKMKSKEVKSKNPECFRIQDFWCGQQDSNLHALAGEPKSPESTNSTMPAYFLCLWVAFVGAVFDRPRANTVRPYDYLYLYFYTERDPRWSVSLDPRFIKTGEPVFNRACGRGEKPSLR